MKFGKIFISWGGIRGSHAPPLGFNDTGFLKLPRVSINRFDMFPRKKSGSKGPFGGHLGFRHERQRKFKSHNFFTTCPRNINERTFSINCGIVNHLRTLF